MGNEENHRETGKRQAASTGEAHVLLVTNDVANAQFARGAGIAVASMRTYVTQILKCPEVEDLLPMTAIGKGDDTDNDVNGDKTGSGTQLPITDAFWLLVMYSGHALPFVATGDGRYCAALERVSAIARRGSNG